MKRVYCNLHRVIFLVAALTAVVACGKVNDDASLVNNTGKHSANWITLHGAETPKLTAASCTQCHGMDLAGGISKISCFNTSRSGIVCHPNSHQTGWSAAGNHGSAAKAATPGLGNCTGCHGTDYKGGVGKSCMTCHTTAPHPQTPWRGTTTSGTTHATTNQSNASECSRCHAGNARRTTPATPLPGAGCFNNTLCHPSVLGHVFPNPGSVHLATANVTDCLVCHAQGSTASTYPAVAVGTPPDCRSCHLTANPGTSPQCSDCHGSAANNSAGVLRAGRPVGGTTFPNRPGMHNISGHIDWPCTVCHPFTTGDPRHGWSNGAQSTAAQVGGTYNLITSWDASTKSCTALCHTDPAAIRNW